ncbi:MAG: Fis family transcriptional regulator [Caulobacteraceae bacterium]|nr:Fis family transcriptional regulator [Caulobacteraceae bacterium]
MRALIVDDCWRARQILSRVLCQLGFSTVEVGSGADALTWLDREQTDLIVTDLQMPNMDGLKFIEHARKTPNGAGTPILVLSSDDCPVDAAILSRCGILGWLTKPIDIPSLARHLGTLSQAAA